MQFSDVYLYVYKLIVDSYLVHLHSLFSCKTRPYCCVGWPPTIAVAKCLAGPPSWLFYRRLYSHNAPPPMWNFMVTCHYSYQNLIMCTCTLYSGPEIWGGAAVCNIQKSLCSKKSLYNFKLPSYIHCLQCIIYVSQGIDTLGPGEVLSSSSTFKLSL